MNFSVLTFPGQNPGGPPDPWTAILLEHDRAGQGATPALARANLIAITQAYLDGDAPRGPDPDDALLALLQHPPAPDYYWQMARHHPEWVTHLDMIRQSPYRIVEH